MAYQVQNVAYPKKWDTVLIPFPFTDLRAIKISPAVVISPDAFNANSLDALFMLITPHAVKRAAHDIVIEMTHPEFRQTGLMHMSCIRISKIVILETTLVERALGALGPQLSSALQNQLGAFFQLLPYEPPLVESRAEYRAA